MDIVLNLPRAKICILAISFAIIISATVRKTHADTVIYSFENGVDDFAANPAGSFDITQDTIGHTDGEHSLKIDIPALAPGFVGALTPTLPAAFGDPPGLDHVTFDMTLTAPFSPEPPALSGFAVIGLTIFSVTQPGPGQHDVQVQIPSALEIHIDGKAAGTYTNLTFPLTNLTHPLTFAQHVSFNDIFGTVGSGENDLIPTGFEFFFNKTSADGYPLTVYLDNVRVGTAPPPLAGDYNGNGTVDAADYVVWRNGGPLAAGTEVADPGTVSDADYTEWRARFGNSSGSGSGGGSLSLAATPEPATSLLLLIAAASVGLGQRNRKIWQIFRVVD